MTASLPPRSGPGHHRPIGTVAVQRVAPPPAAPEGAVPAPAPPPEPFTPWDSTRHARPLAPAHEPAPAPGRDGLIVAAVVAGVLALAVGILWIAGLGGGAASAVPASAPAGAAAAGGASTSVRYEITGTGTGTVTYTDGRGAMGQEAVAPLPWSTDFTAGEYFTVLTLGVTSTDGGPVGCRILKDGAVVSEQQADGRLATATCSGH